jgi:hypothetical protein
VVQRESRHASDRGVMSRRGGWRRTLETMLLASVCLWLSEGTTTRAQMPTPVPNATPTRNECDPSFPECPVGTECYCCCGAFRCAPPFAPCCAIPCISPTPAPTPTPTVGECNPLASACPLGTTCGCCCGAWQCLLPETICCEIACVLPTPPPTATATPTATTTARMRQFCDPTPCSSGLVCVINPFRGGVCDCIGDCDDDYEVNVNELVAMVDVALGKTEVSTCRLGDVNGDGEIGVDEILEAVNNTLYGCGENLSPSPPTATRTAMPTPMLPHGHTCCECGNAGCEDFAWVEVEPVCPLGCQIVMDAECEAPCHGGPQSGSATCVPLTPCNADDDCDDGNPCTADRCTINGCTHACVCD